MGPSSRLFLIDGSGGTYSVNPEVTHRFFPPHLRRQPGLAGAFSARKEPGTVRVFALGASTLVGYPNARGTDFPRFLELMLADVFPARRFEIINCGITAVNSHCLLDFSREVVEHYDPDLLVVYAGHNEFIGPYGPTTPFVGFGSARSLIRAHMFLQRSRLYHGARELMFALSSFLGTKPATFGLHLATEEIDWTQDSYSRVVANYRANLDAMVTAAAEQGVPVLLSTLVSNLKDFYPLRSECGGLDSADGQLLAAEVMDLARQGQHERAQARVLEGLRRSPQCAAVHFEMARLHHGAGHYREAKAFYIQARDLDRVPFRAPTVFNEVVREIGQRHANAIVSDVEGAFAAATPGGITGDELLTDYLHPTVYGHHLLARTLVEDLANSAVASKWGPAQPASIGKFEHYRDRLGYSEVSAALARNNLILFLRNMPYRTTPVLIRERVSELIEAQAAVYQRLSAEDRDLFRSSGGLAFLGEALSFAPSWRRSSLAAILEELEAGG